MEGPPVMHADPQITSEADLDHALWSLGYLDARARELQAACDLAVQQVRSEHQAMMVTSCHARTAPHGAGLRRS